MIFSNQSREQKPSLKSLTLKRLAEKFLPTQTKFIRDSRLEPESSADALGVDELHGILDEAKSGDTRRLFATYRDLVLGHSHAQTELNTRKLAVVGEPPIFEPHDKDDPESVAASELIADIWDSYTSGREAITHLLDATLWPVALLEKTYKESTVPGRRYEIAALRPVPYHLLDYTEGRLRIRDTDSKGNHTGGFHEPDVRRYIMHRGHLLTSIPDNFGGPMKAALFWWLFSTMDRDWWIRFLERFGSPFIVGKYDTSDPGAKTLLTQAFSAATRLFGLTVSRDTDVEIHAAATTSHGDAFEAFHSTATRELSKLILGQTMTSEAQAGGIGGTQAEIHNQVRGDIRQFDSMALSDTLRHQLFAQLIEINGIAAKPPILRWGTDKADAKTLAETIETLHRANLVPAEASLKDISLIIGFSIERGEQAAITPAELAAFAAAQPSAIDPTSRLAQLTANRWAADIRTDLQAKLDAANSPKEFAAQLTLPANAEIAEDLLATAAANALLR